MLLALVGGSAFLAGLVIGLVVGRLTLVLALVVLTGCATAAPCACLYGRPVPVEFVQRCGA